MLFGSSGGGGNPVLSSSSTVVLFFLLLDNYTNEQRVIRNKINTFIKYAEKCFLPASSNLKRASN